MTCHRSLFYRIMKNKLKINLNELLQEGIITSEQLDQINEFHQKKSGLEPNRILILFAIIGSALIGLGIILIIGHNWDSFPRAVKTMLGFLPLIIGQIACLYTLLRKTKSQVWREASSCFLFFAIGASIAMISQIYHLQGSLDSFLLVWMILALPVVYLMNSSSVSILYTLGISYYLLQTFPKKGDYGFFSYWGLLLAIIPYYITVWKSNLESPTLKTLHWLLPLSMVFSLFKFMHDGPQLLSTFLAVCILFYQIGLYLYHHNRIHLNNSYRTIGMIGSIIILFIGSFSGFWSEISTESSTMPLLSSIYFWIGITCFIAAIVLLLLNNKSSQSIHKIILTICVLLAYPLFFIDVPIFIKVIVINLMILMIAVSNIKDGFNQSKLSVMNLGMIYITILIICRFFDFDISFIIRGIVFVLIGLAFFAANYILINQNNSDE